MEIDQVIYKISDHKNFISEIKKDIEEVIAIVTEQTHLNEKDAYNLLIENNWDRSKALDVFFGGNYGNKNLKKDRMQAECCICLLRGQSKDIIKLACNHQICKNCCRNIFKLKIKIHTIDDVMCPQKNCYFKTRLEYLRWYFLDNNDKIDYLMCSFIKTNKRIKNCPNCYKLIRIMSDFEESKLKITCNCDHKFCFKCLEPWHEILDCEFIKKYKELVFIANALKELSSQNSINESNAYEVYEWLRKKIKICPNCSGINEKPDSFVEMKCQKCKYTLYNQDEQLNESTFNLQMDSFIELMIQTQFIIDSDYENCALNYFFHKTKIINEKENFSSISNDEKWKDALSILRESHYLLIYTYIFSYFTIETDEILKGYQQDLEKNTQNLVLKIIELDEEDISTIDKCISISECIISYIKNGYNGIWKFKFGIKPNEN